MLLFLLGRWTTPEPPVISETIHTVTRVVRDTVTVDRPVTRYVHTRDSILVPIRDTLRLRDTLYVEIPREVKIYQDDRYRAEVSGYQPSLDRIDIYQQTQYIDREVVRTVTGKKNTRWGIGLSAGYGVAINTADQAFRPAPYIGLGIHYSFISW